MFELQGASFILGDRALLQPLDLHLPDGQVVGLIGHNGSGKSTLIKLLARQQGLSAGEITFDGRPLAQWNNRDFARRVAYLPQQLPAADGLTVRELVSFGRYPWHGALGRFGAADRQSIERALQLTHTEVYAGRLVDSLSGGERQRVWLAMLLAQDTNYLLLDEPTSALDIAHQVEVLQLIRELSHRLRLGVVVVLHEINMAARYCDHLVALHGGRLLVQGSPEELMDGATLESIYGIPMGVIPHPVNGRPLSFHL
ncbi:ATP-binding cassette domain-containing protein [Pseudomonas oryzihabitans]|uniref:ATP-binding cassette domain-containing protein n=1 Tax=Pseudomonas oryzihabitans TaxID=47885 RepID=UPI0028952FC0|nr:ATP-binding cassette domain-containing protein [Pseudomonas oryzihabitans]MDT3720156.1 ATP-binding cassette domain-containing protein [Pseudomonas oryzihabitans]